MSGDILFHVFLFAYLLFFFLTLTSL